jgi:hypothetical protein
MTTQSKPELIARLNKVFAETHPFKQSVIDDSGRKFDLSIEVIDIVYFNDSVAYAITQPVNRADDIAFAGIRADGRTGQSRAWAMYFDRFYAMYEIDLVNGYVSHGLIAHLNKDIDKANRKIAKKMKEWNGKLCSNYIHHAWAVTKI